MQVLYDALETFCHHVYVPNFRGCQGQRTGVWVTTVSNSLILGGWVTKGLRIVRKIGEWKGG